MRFRTALIAGAALLASAAPAIAAPQPPDAEARLARLIGDRIPGRPVDCINQSSITSSQIIDGTAIAYRVGARLYVNRLRDNGRNFLRSDDILVTRTITGQLCSLDTVRLLDRTSRIPHGFAVLDKFVPYVNPARAR